MTSPEPEIDPLIDALRSDLPNSEHESRVRARLVAAGVIVTGGLAAPGTAAGASALNAAGGAKTGVLSKAVSLFGGSKIGLAAVVVVGSAAVPIATYVAKSSTPDEPATVARDARPSKSSVMQPQPASQREVSKPALEPPQEPAPARAVADTKAARPVAAPEPSDARRPSEPLPAAPPSAVAVFPALQNRSAASTLREETELVDWALSALRSGDTAGARALLQEHAQRFPNGALVRERERALERVKHAEATR